MIVVAFLMLIPCLCNDIQRLIRIMAKALIIILPVLKILIPIKALINTFVKALEPSKYTLDLI